MTDAAMTFLIDGYNLLHALGLGGRQMPKGGLERARQRLLEWLDQAHGDGQREVYVIFDAQHGARRASAEPSPPGVQVQFAVGQLADDLIEELIAAQPRPKELTVVSNDHRLQDAARRRGCVAWSCGEYIDRLLARQDKQPETAAEEAPKPGEPNRAEVDEWLRRFGC